MTEAWMAYQPNSRYVLAREIKLMSCKGVKRVRTVETCMHHAHGKVPKTNSVVIHVIIHGIYMRLTQSLSDRDSIPT